MEFGVCHVPCPYKWNFGNKPFLSKSDSSRYIFYSVQREVYHISAFDCLMKGSSETPKRSSTRNPVFCPLSPPRSSRLFGKEGLPKIGVRPHCRAAPTKKQRQQTDYVTGHSCIITAAKIQSNRFLHRDVCSLPARRRILLESPRFGRLAPV